jgi:hypothetical protein
MRGAFPQRAAAAASARAEPLVAGARAGHGADVGAALGACAR